KRALHELPGHVPEGVDDVADAEIRVLRPLLEKACLSREAHGRREHEQRRDVLLVHRGMDGRECSAEAVAEDVRLSARRALRDLADRAAEIAIADVIEREVSVLVARRAPVEA